MRFIDALGIFCMAKRYDNKQAKLRIIDTIATYNSLIANNQYLILYINEYTYSKYVWSIVDDIDCSIAIDNSLGNGEYIISIEQM